VSKIFDIADEYVDKVAELSPITATALGIPGHDHEITDYSPDGAEASAALDRSTLQELDAAESENEQDRVAREAMAEQIRLSLDMHDAGEHLRQLSIIHSPIHSIRMTFDLMPRDTDEQWNNIAARLNLVSQGLESFRRSLEEGGRQGKVVSKRQATETASQCRVWSGSTEGQSSFFDGLLNAYDEAGIGSDSLRRDIERGAQAANGAMDEMAAYLTDTYAPEATDRDAVGLERYTLASRTFNGIELDLAETYHWGWEQLRWVNVEMSKTAEQILPGGSVAEAENLLETDPERSIEGEDAFKNWMQELQDHTIEELNGIHFDIAEPVKTIEALIAPPGGALAMYYTPPSEDFSRPGRTWYPTGGKTVFPIWGEVSIAYHEGVPGHHFQLATTTHLSSQLSRFQRLLGGSSGYVEGWGLYAERLMAELGYMENPDYYLGMLRAQALRSVRVIIDIGMHLELDIPSDESFHPGETWTPDLGQEFINLNRHGFPVAFMASEISRYLGLPGQAISYKVGERVWREVREEVKKRQGAAFDLKQFHTRALNLGPMGLAQMQRELTKI
jgi:uncharacterized protein (DUF885 family)